MIIKDIQLTNFGKFNHKYISLEPGLNIIYGENEAGKTTLHTFIRGLKSKEERQVLKIPILNTSHGTILLIIREPWELKAME